VSDKRKANKLEHSNFPDILHSSGPHYEQKEREALIENGILNGKKKLRGFSPQANYTELATAACRRS
jgi:hypothetical protein